MIYSLFDHLNLKIIKKNIFLISEKNKTEANIDYEKDFKMEDMGVDADKTERIKFMVNHFVRNFQP